MEQRRGHAHQQESKRRPILTSNECINISIYTSHYFCLPIQNEQLLRKLYLELDLSSYQISEFTGWSRTAISDALRLLDIKKDKRKGPNAAFGMKKEGTTYVVHKGEKKVIKMILTLREKGLPFPQIAIDLNNKNYKTKMNKSWTKVSVREVYIKHSKKDKL